MKTQTSQLSLLETEQVTGGLVNLEAPLTHALRPRDFLYGILPPNLHITLSTAEDGGKFDILE